MATGKASSDDRKTGSKVASKITAQPVKKQRRTCSKDRLG